MEKVFKVGEVIRDINGWRKVLYIDERFIWTSNFHHSKLDAENDNNIASQYKESYLRDHIWVASFDLTPKQEEWCSCGLDRDKVLQYTCPRCEKPIKPLKPPSELEEIKELGAYEYDKNGTWYCNRPDIITICNKVDALIRNQRKLEGRGR